MQITPPRAFKKSQKLSEPVSMPELLITCRLSGVQFHETRKPIVYIWKRKDEYLYIGLGACGISRILCNHEHINAKNVEIQDEILWIYLDTIEQARKKEYDLIREHKPRYNIACNPDQLGRKRLHKYSGAESPDDGLV